MKITFGMSLDGPAFPDLLTTADAVMGKTIYGPLGLIEELETRLGLKSTRATEAERVEQFRQRLNTLNHGNQFYSKSLQKDEFAVAQTLLNWRDELILNGWNPENDNHISPRLSELAQVELLKSETSAPDLSPGFADRFRTVLKVLPCPIPEISEILLTWPKKQFSKPWFDLFDLLRKCGISFLQLPPPGISGTSDLGKLQSCVLKGPGSTNPMHQFQGDGSLVIIKPDFESEAVDLIAQWAVKNGHQQTVVIADDGDRTIDLAFSENGLPAMGIQSQSQNRPALQILPLAFSLLWNPLNPYRLLEFLMLPQNPIPRGLRSRLSKAVAEEPGMGGEKWEAAIEEWIEAKNQKTESEQCGNAFEADQGSLQQKSIDLTKNIKKLIQQWIPSQRFDPAEGVPLSRCAVIAEQVLDWAKKQSMTEISNGLMMKNLGSKAMELRKLIVQFPEDTINVLQLNCLIKLVQGSGSHLSSVQSQADHLPRVKNPLAVIGPAERIIWWNCVQTNRLDNLIMPWTKSEFQGLYKGGVQLMNSQKKAEQQMTADKNPVLFAEKQLILVIPAALRGESVSPHPLYSLIAGAFENPGIVEMTVRQWLNKGHKFFNGLESSKLPYRTFPQTRRWWKLPSGELIKPREIESYSSLESLLYYPFKWVLQYQARLKKSSFLDIADGRRLLGNLAHAMLQKMLVSGHAAKHWTVPVIEEWVKSNMTDLLSKQGAVLLLPGKEPERERLIRTTIHAAHVLFSSLQKNKWQVRGIELPCETVLASQKLCGWIDLVLEKPDCPPAVVDFKWSGTRFRRDQLAENRALQLSIYAHSMDSKIPVHQAFFIIETAKLIAHDQSGFQDAWVSKAKSGDAFSYLWGQMEQTFRWRWRLLQEGWIEVPVRDKSNKLVAPDEMVPEEDEAPEGCLQMPEDAPKFNDFDILTGFFD